MNLTELQRRDYPEVLDNVEAIIRLARANFPRTNEMRIETCGSSPHATMTISWTVLAFMIECARETLAKAEGRTP